MVLPPLDAILFDFDGTLVEPSIDFGHMHDVVLAVVGRHGLDTELYRGMYVLELIDRARQQLARNDHGRAEAFVGDTDRAILEIEIEAAERVSAYPRVPQMLAGLKERSYGVGIVTRNCRAAVERVLQRIPMPHDVLLTRDDVTYVKPHPEHLLAALRVLRVGQGRALMCGDHVMDVLAGQRAGLMTAGVLRPGVEASYFDEAAPDVVLARVTDLCDHLRDG